MKRLVPWIPIAGLILLVALVATSIVTKIGYLGFTLDDPYIHLSVAENLVQNGLYGINPSEVASPSSSVVWPFLLVPLELLGIGPTGTFALNLFFAIFALFVVGRIAASHAEARAAAMLATAWFLGCNLVGLVFTGMEHVAQVAIVVVIARGSLRTLEGGAVPAYLWGALILAPLIRYEDLAISVPVTLWLIAQGHRARGAATAAAMGVCLGAFSLALWSNGMWLLPSSVVAKSTHIKDNGLWAPLANFFFNVMDWPGAVVLVLGMVLVGIALVRRGEADPQRFDGAGRLALAGAAAAILHLLFGRNGWYHRYEAYAVAYTTVLIVGLWPKQWTSRTAAVGALAMLVVGWQYTLSLRSIPHASANIAGQQLQLHRLAVELDAPVGVNDLGWVSYRNEQYVYDFYGLGNYDATEHRLAKDGVQWMEDAARRENLQLVMISTVWFNDEVPTSWTAMGALCNNMPLVTLKGTEVRFFAPAPPTPQLRTHIEQWAKGLPETAQYTTDRCQP